MLFVGHITASVLLFAAVGKRLPELDFRSGLPISFLLWSSLCGSNSYQLTVSTVDRFPAGWIYLTKIPRYSQY